MIARSNKLLLIAATLALLAGCASAVKVPEEAQLVWYGKPPVQFGTIPTNSGSGQIYLYDDTSHRVVSVLPVTDRASFNISGLKDDHDYALYFVPKLSAPSLSAKPSTSAAQ